MHAKFRVLNNRLFNELDLAVADPIHGYYEDLDADRVMDELKALRPRGTTPLAEHVANLTREIKRMKFDEGSLRRRVAVCIVTDGVPSDQTGKSTTVAKQEFMDAFQELCTLPVWIVVRLCTKKQQTINFYNSLDYEREKRVDVLLDCESEAREIRRFNPWLNYNLELHRSREAGLYHSVIDLLDERPLTRDEIPELLGFFFGQWVRSSPDDWQAYCGVIESVDKQCYWNPLKKKRLPWINVRLLRQR